MKLKYYLICLIILCISLVSCQKPNNEEAPKEEKKVDEIAPLIQFYFEEKMVIEKGEIVDLKKDIVGLDNIDGKITDKIIIDDGGFDSNKPGNYTIFYSLKDSSGNYAKSVSRTITVIDSKNAQLVAHRGGKGFGLENTKEAFEKAIELGYYGVECDVQATKDNVLVVYHDLNISRLTGIDKNIKDVTWEYLETLTFTKKETDGITYTGKMMLFKDYLNLVKSSKTKAFIELKESCTSDTLALVMKEIHEVGLEESQYFIIANSSSISLLVQLRKQSSSIQLQFVARTDYQSYMQICLDNKIDLDVSSSVFQENYNEALGYVNSFLQRGLKVNVWVVNKEIEIKNFASIGVSYFTTDSLIPQK